MLDEKGIEMVGLAECLARLGLQSGGPGSKRGAHTIFEGYIDHRFSASGKRMKQEREGWFNAPRQVSD